jgi:hypothetical protein
MKWFFVSTIMANAMADANVPPCNTAQSLTMLVLMASDEKKAIDDMKDSGFFSRLKLEAYGRIGTGKSNGAALIDDAFVLDDNRMGLTFRLPLVDKREAYEWRLKVATEERRLEDYVADAIRNVLQRKAELKALDARLMLSESLLEWTQQRVDLGLEYQKNLNTMQADHLNLAGEKAALEAEMKGYAESLLAFVDEPYKESVRMCLAQ